ncbi:MAG: PilC/PilY family type IV pilus protein [Pseudohongiellaceae bacterium]
MMANSNAAPDLTRQTLMVIRYWLLAVLVLGASTARAAPLDLANGPLFLGVSVDPNVFFMVDDSGSMDWEIMVGEHAYYLNYWEDAGVANNDDGTWLSFASTGQCAGRRSFVYYFQNDDNAYDSCFYPERERNGDSEQRDWRIRSSDFNLLFYNPEVDYEPWPGMPDADFTAARSNPQPGTDGYSLTRNLTGFRYDVALDDKGHIGSIPSGPSSATDGGNGRVDLFDSRIHHTVGGTELTVEAFTTASADDIQALDQDCSTTSAAAPVPFADCFGTTVETSTVSGSETDTYGRTLDETRQNIANWYEYHRKRSSVTRDAISQVVTSSPSYRFGLGLINEYDELFVPVPNANTDEYSSHNSNLIEAFREHQWQALGTPLRQGLERVGQYYDGGLGYDDPIISACQQHFSVLFTDGYWSGDAPSDSISDADGDGVSQTLADVARYYYENDLSALPDQVPTTTFDQARHQHMVTFGVAFGVSGELEDTNNDGWPDPELEEDDDWGNPYASDPEKIDDLWHAAYNSRGLFVSAQSPSQVVSAISEAIAAIADRTGSSASVASNSGTLSAESFLYQARFDSSDWSGQLLAFQINPDGSIESSPEWNAANVLNGQSHGGRSILTWSPDAGNAGEGVPFRWPDNYDAPDDDTELSPAQVSELLAYSPFPEDTENAGEIASNQAYGQALTDYLRGERSNEVSGYGFRYRNTVLGDIVNSDPRYVGAPRFHYADNLAAKPYSEFRQHYEDRQAMVYVGANDGMLHGFNEETGAEMLAYVPRSVFSELPELSREDYSHRFFVDGGTNIVDAYLPGANDPVGSGTGAWRSVLAGALGKGGQGVFALDVTDPSRFSENRADELVLWEFTDADDPDLGYTYGRPQIAKMANGRWAAVFGNGYNNTEGDGAASTTGHASLFIVDLETGDLVRKISTESGSSTTPNGLATPVLIDETGDQTVDAIYAGDLQGQLWKFDVSGNNTGQWEVAHSQGGTLLPLFTTEAGQPITTQPQVARHPYGGEGFMVYFGTGKYLELGDNSPTGEPTQAFYGIWDDGQSSDLDSSGLLQQYIEDQYVESYDTDGDDVDETDYTLRDVSDIDIDFSVHQGWKIDLMPQKIQGADNNSNFGERQVSNAEVRDGRIIFTTLLPSQSPCEFGGSSFVMQLNYANGGQLQFPAFDLNGDGSFDDNDSDASGRMTDIGIVPTPSILSDSDSDFAVISGSSGDLDAVELNIGVTASGRQSWRQLE